MLRPDGLRAHLEQFHWDCSDIDIVNKDVEGEGPDAHDLLRGSIWDQIWTDMRAGEYQAILIGTPCETASKARTGPPGPRPLRTPDHLYGLPRDQLTEAEHKQVQEGTYFALQSAKTATLARTLGIPWAIENPDPANNPVSLFNLPEWRSLANLPEVDHVDFHQCPMGAETAKPTRILFWGLDLANLVGFCNHAKQWWTFTTHSGKQRSVFAPHPPLAGRRREDGNMATKAAAAYPAELNLRLAKAIAASDKPRRRASVATE